MIDKLNITESAVILEALLAEGEEKVTKLLKKGKKKESAVAAVAKDMDLTFSEAEALKARVATKKPTIVTAEAAPVSAPENDCLFFESAEEADQAAGILMYKGIPWKSKDNSSKPFIQFENLDAMRSAHDALKRRWDFVESNERKVAVVEFDNLGDFERVMEYMTKQGMLLDYGSDTSLSEDAVEASRKALKGKKAKQFDESSVTADRNSYRAINRSKSAEQAPVNVWEDNTRRVVKARKRWR